MRRRGLAAISTSIALLVAIVIVGARLTSASRAARRLVDCESADDQRQLVAVTENPSAVADALVDFMATDERLSSSLGRRLRALTAIRVLEEQRGVTSRQDRIQMRLAEALEAKRTRSAFLLSYALYASYGMSEGLTQALELIAEVDDVTISHTVASSLARIEVQELRKANRLKEEVVSRSAKLRFDAAAREWVR